MNTIRGRLLTSFLALVFARLVLFLLQAFFLLGLDLGALVVVALALVGELLVLRSNLFFAGLGVTTSASAVDMSE